MRRVVLSLALVSACAGRARVESEPPTATSIPVRVENHTLCDVKVRIEQSGTRLATVRINRLAATTSALRWTGPRAALQVVVEPFACPDFQTYTLGEIPLGADAILVLLEAHPTMSAMRPVDPARIR